MSMPLQLSIYRFHASLSIETEEHLSKASLHKGSTFALSVEHLEYQLVQQGFKLINFKKKTLHPFVYLYHKPSQIQMLYFTQQIAMMLKSGFPLLTAIKEQMPFTSNRLLLSMLYYIEMMLSKGNSLSVTLEQLSPLFSKIYAQLVDIGEQIGDLEMSFSRIAKLLKEQHQSKQKLITAMRYPLFIMGVSMVVLLIMTQFLIPEFKALFLQFNSQLPPLTLWVLNLSNNLPKLCLYFILILIPLLSLSHWFYQYHPATRLKIDRSLLHIPFVGTLLSRYYLITICNTLQLMLSAGIPLLQALNVIGRLMHNTFLKIYLIDVETAIAQGENLGDALYKAYQQRAKQKEKKGIRFLIKQIYIGEYSGEIPRSLLQIAQLHQHEHEQQLQRIEKLLEPTLLLIIGILVAFMISAIYLPILNLNY